MDVITPDRPAIRYLTYSGDVTNNISPNKPMGPTTMGEPVWPVIAIYYPEINKTRVGFSYVAPPKDE